MHVLPIIPVIIFIAFDGTAPSTAGRCGICPFFCIIILVNDFISFQWSNSPEVAWRICPAAWGSKLCSEFIPTISGDTFARALILPHTGCRRIGAIDLITES
jgi:hypothetical protein